MKIALFANTDWYLYNFRRSLALALRDAGHDVLLLSPAGEYGARLQAMGLRWLPLPMERRSLSLMRETRLLWKIAGILKQEKVDVIHGFTIKCAVYGALAARVAGVPAQVSSVAGMGYVFTSRDLKARALRPVVRLLMRFALNGKNARLILQNPDDMALFRQSGLVDGQNIRLIAGSGVDCRRFTYTPLAATDRTPLRVLLAARLLRDKGIVEYMDAIRLLRAEGSTMVFLMAGLPDAGNPASFSTAEVQRWVAEGLVEWLGHVDDMPGLLAQVAVVALPSYREGLPKTLIEAAACGKGLVTTDVPGCREVVEHAVNGLLVPPRNARKLADAFSRLDQDRALLSRLGTAAAERARSFFDERIVIGKTLAVYREVFPSSE